MAQAIEMVRFTAKPGEEEALVTERPAMLDALRAQYPGIVSARLAKLEGVSAEGTTSWLDVIVWESREQALAAAEGAPRIPIVAAWFSHMADVIGVEHADVVVAG